MSRLQSQGHLHGAPPKCGERSDRRHRQKRIAYGTPVALSGPLFLSPLFDTFEYAQVRSLVENTGPKPVRQSNVPEPRPFLSDSVQVPRHEAVRCRTIENRNRPDLALRRLTCDGSDYLRRSRALRCRKALDMPRRFLPTHRASRRSGSARRLAMVLGNCPRCRGRRCSESGNGMPRRHPTRLCRLRAGYR